MGIRKSRLVVLVAVLVVAMAAVFGFSHMHKDKPPQTPQPTQNTQVQQAPKNEVSYQGVEGQNALDLLKKGHKVETKTYEGLGELVISIDGTAADSKHFWSFYVNGQQSQVGAGAYVAKSTDMIVWKLEEIK